MPLTHNPQIDDAYVIQKALTNQESYLKLIRDNAPDYGFNKNHQRALDFCNIAINDLYELKSLIEAWRDKYGNEVS